MSASKSFLAEAERTDDFTHVLLITTGSVASIKAPLIVVELLKVSQATASLAVTQTLIILSQYRNVKVEVVATKASLSFYDSQEVAKSGVRVWRDADEWGPYVRANSLAQTHNYDV